MHDPYTVAFEIRRPWPQRSSLGRPPSSSWIPRGLVHFKPRFRTSPFLEWRGRAFYFPSLITIWHVDPNNDDGRCRRKWAETRKQPGLHGWLWRRLPRPYSWHIHHWSIQVRPIQALRRWLFTRCAECGQRFPYGYAPISQGWDSPKRTFWQRWTQGERGLFHHGRCASVSSIRRIKDAFDNGFDDKIGLQIQAQSGYWYMGCYPWWRQKVLGEHPAAARVNAANHVQREGHPCPRCTGIGCKECDDTGHRRVENPIPVSAIDRTDDA